jgi:flagellar biosynthesis protein FliR
MNEALFFAFLLVFVRCSAMLLSSPMFGAQNTPLPVRIFTTLAISAAMTLAINPAKSAAPPDLGSLSMAMAGEIAAGLLLGFFMSLVLQAAQLAGAIMDLQLGLSMSQVMNPVSGIQVTILAQFKFMLGTVLYLCLDGHHQMLTAFANSYKAMPALGVSTMPVLLHNVVGMISGISILALQIAAPVMAVSLVVDAALGIINKAVPQMQTMVVGMPAKIMIGMIALGVALPALATGINSGIGFSMDSLGRIFQMR